MKDIKPTCADRHFCDFCEGDEALYYQDGENCAFVDSHGEVMVVVNGHILQFKVDHCPKCGRRFGKTGELKTNRMGKGED